MDTFFSKFGRRLAVFALSFALTLVSVSAFADLPGAPLNPPGDPPPISAMYPDEASAMSACVAYSQWADGAQDYADSYGGGYAYMPSKYRCLQLANPARDGFYDHQTQNKTCPSGYTTCKNVGSGYNDHDFLYPHPSCHITADRSYGVYGETNLSPYTASDDGCCAVVTPTYQTTPPWEIMTFGQTHHDGNACPMSDPRGGGDPGTGNAPQPRPPTAPPACTGTACFHPDNDNICMSSGGVDICIPLTTTQGSGGGCGSGAGGAICGAPAPSPQPTPPNPPIPDPTGDTSGTVTANTADGTGTVIPIIVTTYTPPGAPPPTSGPGGDPTGGVNGTNPVTPTNPSPTTTPTSGSSSGGQSNKCPSGQLETASGCNGAFADVPCSSPTPPPCSGDAVLCGITNETWRTRCAVEKQSPASSSTAGLYSHDPFDASGDPVPSSVENTVDTGDTSGIDSGGFGYGTSCPATDVVVDIGGNFGSFSVPFSKVCDWLPLLRAFILAFAYFSAAKIAAGIEGV